MEWFEETPGADWAQRIRVKEVLYREQYRASGPGRLREPAWGRVLALDGVVQTTTGDEFATTRCWSTCRCWRMATSRRC